MTPDERRMIEDLFQRLSQNGASLDKDMQADRLINDLMRRNPDAPYMLAQTTLVYEHQMAEQQARIAELEDEISNLSRGQAPASGGSFLGGRIGSQRGGSVPAAGNSASEPASPWGNRQGSSIGSARNSQSTGFSGYDRQQPPQQTARGGMMGGPASMPPQPQAPGGGFFRSALATAAGVAGGMMLANSLGGLFGGSGAHAAEQNSGMKDADQTQDELQDAQFEADEQQDDLQDASFDAGGDFDSFET